MYDEAVGYFLAALELVSDWFVTCKMIKKLYAVFYAGDNILHFSKDSGNVEFFCNGKGILIIDLNNINLDNDFDEDDPVTIILIRLLAWRIKFETCKALKKRN